MEEELHSSLHCLFVLLVVHGLVFPIPLLSVGGASLQMGNTMVMTHYSIMVCCLMDKRVGETLKTISKVFTAVVVVFQFVILF